MNTPVSFEIAKLLKEKDFDERCNHGYWFNKKNPTLLNNATYANSQHQIYDGRRILALAPTIADVVMWLHEKHGIWISVFFVLQHKAWDYSYTNINWTEEENSKELKQELDNIINNLFRPTVKKNSPTEAYLEAIKYTLTDLI